MMIRPDDQLLREWVETRSDEAFAEIVRRYINLVYSAARRQVREPALAEDVTQAVFVVLSQKAHRLREETVLGAWLLGTTRLEASTALRSRRRRLHHEQRSAQMNPQASGEESSRDWEKIEPMLDEALGELSAADRRMLVLKFFENKSHQEAAAALGITEAASRQRVFRAVERLREFFLSRGVQLSESALSAAISANAIAPAPAALSAATSAAVSVAAAKGLAAGKGAFILMTWTKANAVAVAAAFLLMIGAGVILLTLHDASGSGSLQEVKVVPIAPQTQQASPQPVVLPPSQDPDFNIPQTKGPKWKDGGHPLYTPIQALSYDDRRGGRDGFDHVGFIDRSTVLRYNGVNLGSGIGTLVVALSCPDEYAGKQIVVHSDRQDGEVIATLTVAATHNWGKFETQAAPLAGPAGVHDVYLTFTGGGFNVRSIKFVKPGRDATSPIAGSSYADAVGVTEEASLVRRLDAGDWLHYDGVEFDEGIKFFLVNYSSGNPAEGGMQVHLDSIDGPVIAERPILSTNGTYATTASALLKTVTGTHDLYVTFSGPENLSADMAWFKFARKLGTASAAKNP